MPIRQLLDSNAFNPEEVTMLCDVRRHVARAPARRSKRPRHLAHREEDNRTRAPRRTRPRAFASSGRAGVLGCSGTLGNASTNSFALRMPSCSSIFRPTTRSQRARSAPPGYRTSERPLRDAFHRPGQGHTKRARSQRRRSTARPHRERGCHPRLSSRAQSLHSPIVLIRLEGHLQVA